MISLEFGVEVWRNGFCDNVGRVAQGEEIWYPAEFLKIVVWQVVRSKDPDLTQVMVKTATRVPSLNQIVMRNGALEPLQITPVAQQYYSNFGLRVEENLTIVKANVQIIEILGILMEFVVVLEIVLECFTTPKHNTPCYSY
ncbi:hypothetical protein EAF04_010410 [Stromatinia cepivora]|nr:hypothetical protein EAF04_010410 [Stromatinia cepivora]